MKALIAIDGSAESGAALETAATLTWPIDSRLEVLTVLPSDADLNDGPWAVGVAYAPSEDYRKRLRASRQLVLDAALARLGHIEVDLVTRLEHGRPASVIVDIAREIGADLIILGARGHGVLERTLVGSVSAEVVDEADCAVLIARRGSARRLLVATDGSAVSSSAIGFVGRSGLFDAGEARVVHVLDLHPDWWLGFTPGDGMFPTDAYVSVADDGRKWASELTARGADQLRSDGLNTSAAVLNGAPARSIVNEAKRWGADVVVVGTRGNGLLKRLILGSTARSVMHHADVSVLITSASTVSGGPTPERSVTTAVTPVHA